MDGSLDNDGFELGLFDGANDTLGEYDGTEEGPSEGPELGVNEGTDETLGADEG